MSAVRDALLEEHMSAALSGWPGARLIGEAPQLSVELDRSSKGDPLRLSARRDDAWLLLEGPLRLDSLQAAGDILAAGAALPGGVKFAAATASSGAVAFRTRAELLVDNNPGFATNLRDALRGFAQAEGESAPPSATRGAESEEQVRSHCSQMLEQAGYSLSARASGSLFVDLDTGASGVGFAQAELAIENGSAAFRCSLVADDVAHPQSVAAISRVCLYANSRVRLARAVIGPDGEVRAEVALGAEPSDAFIRVAIEALSVYVATLRLECEALAGDPLVAEHYLARSQVDVASGPSPRAISAATSQATNSEVPASA